MDYDLDGHRNGEEGFPITLLRCILGGGRWASPSRDRFTCRRTSREATKAAKSTTNANRVRLSNQAEVQRRCLLS